FIDRLYEPAAALLIFVLRLRPLVLFGLPVVEIISRSGVFADPVLMIQPHVKPDRAVKGAMLIQAKPGELVVKSLGGFRVGEITIRNSTIGNRARDAMDQLPNGCLAPAFARVVA